MLLANGVRAGGGPMRFNGGNSALAVERSYFSTLALIQGFNVSEATVVAGQSIANTSGRPSGVRHPQAWVLAVKGGGFKSFRRAKADLTGSALAELGFPRQAAADMALEATATGGAVASGSGTGAMDFEAASTIVATLSSASAGDMVLEGQAALGADASLGSTGAMSLDGSAEIMGIGFFSATTADQGGGGLTPADLLAVASAVLDAAAAAPIAANVKKVNDLDVDGSGTEGDPWGPV